MFGGGGASQRGVAAANDKGLVKAIGELRVARAYPAAGGVEDAGGFIGVIGHERGGVPGEFSGAVAVVIAFGGGGGGGEAGELFRRRGEAAAGERGEVAPVFGGGARAEVAVPDCPVGFQLGAEQIQSVVAEVLGGAPEGGGAFRVGPLNIEANARILNIGGIGRLQVFGEIWRARAGGRGGGAGGAGGGRLRIYTTRRNLLDVCRKGSAHPHRCAVLRG